MASKQLQRNMFVYFNTIYVQQSWNIIMYAILRKKYKVGRYDVFIHMWSSSNTIHHLKILLTLRVQNILKL